MSSPLMNGMSVWFRDFLRSSSPSRPRRAPQPGGVRASLRGEQLEDRRLLTASANQVFTATLYQGLLQRDAEPAGLAAWTSQLDGGSSRTQVVRGFVGSAEYRNDEVQGLYQSLLGRQADSGGLKGWTDRLASGTSFTQVKANFMGSDEYFQRAGNNDDAYLSSVYEEDLGRAADQVGEAAWRSKLQDGVPRTTVADLMATSPEAEQREVKNDYRQILSRDPDLTGLTGWTSAIEQSDGDNTPVATAMLASGEFAIQEANFLGTLMDQVTDPNSATRQFLDKTMKSIDNAFKESPLDKQAIKLSTNSLELQANLGQANNPASTFTITNDGPKGSTLEYKVTGHLSLPGGSQQELILSSPNRPLNSGDHDDCKVTVDLTSLKLDPGTYAGQITVSDKNGKAPQQIINLKLVVSNGFEGTYTGKYSGSQQVTPYGPYTGVDGTITLKILGTRDTGGVTVITSGTITLSNFRGQQLSLSIAGGYFSNDLSFAADSDAGTFPLISVSGTWSGTAGVRSIKGPNPYGMTVLGANGTALNATFDISNFPGGKFQ